MVITVKEFRFAGNTLMTNEQLAPAVAVAEVYRSAGWVVNACLPQQDIQGGIITLQIVEAVFGGLKMEGAMPSRMRGPHVESIIAHQQATGTYRLKAS